VHGNVGQKTHSNQPHIPKFARSDSRFESAARIRTQFLHRKKNGNWHIVRERSVAGLFGDALKKPLHSRPMIVVIRVVIQETSVPGSTLQIQLLGLPIGRGSNPSRGNSDSSVVEHLSSEFDTCLQHHQLIHDQSKRILELVMAKMTTHISDIQGVLQSLTISATRDAMFGSSTSIRSIIAQSLIELGQTAPAYRWSGSWRATFRCFVLGPSIPIWGASRYRPLGARRRHLRSLS
jgi:hypothetical protein